jgi:photosystem II stability/assembly factor-like uncharacterized protein
MNTNTISFAFCALVALGQASFSCGARAQTNDQDHLRENILKQLQWHELGPVQSGGRIVDIAVHPTRPQVYWLASASGGVWHTNNGGLSFTPQFQNKHSISIGDICVAPSNPDVLYVGTGEANNQRSSYWGNGVHKSTDGGLTWKHVGLNGTDHIGRIVVHPEDPNTVYVAALGALYRSNEERGLYKTTDGGESWKRIHHINPHVGFADVALHPQKHTTVFATSYERRRRAWTFIEGGQGSRLWRSTDSGNTWEQMENGLPEGKLGRIGIDTYAKDGDVLYATIENLNPVGQPTKPATNPTEDERDREQGRREATTEEEHAPSAEILADPVARQMWFAGSEEAQDPKRRSRRKFIGGEVYRSDDGGDSWQKTHNNKTSVGGSPGYYYGQVRIDPNDKDTLYVLSVPVYKSIDGGETWTPARRRRGRGRGASSFGSSLHVDHHALWIDPNNSDHCLLGNDGGIAVTWDQGDNWDHLTHLPLLQFYAIGVDRGAPYKIYGGLQDNGTWGFPIHGKTNDGIEALDAFKVSGGDGFYSVVDPSDPNTVYSESQFGGMIRSNLRTGNTTSIKPRNRKGEQALRFNWNTPIVISPHAPHTIYTGSQKLHRSRDRGDHWATISDDLSTNDPDKKRGNVPHCTITTISESPITEGMLWVGTDDGNIWLSKDGGNRWHDLSDRFPATVKGLWVSRVEASTNDKDTAFVSFTGYREDNRDAFVFRTDDAGDNWLSISNDLPQEPVNVVREHPRNPNVLLVGTEMHAYVSVDSGAHWSQLGHDLPRVAVHDLIVHPDEPHILVGTHGRGIWAMDASALERLTTSNVRQAMLALPPSDGVLLRSKLDRGYVGAREWRTKNPFTNATFRYVLAQDSDTDVLIEVLDANGEVVWKTDGKTEAGYHEIAWARPARGRGGFGGFGGRRRGRAAGQRAGDYAVRISMGDYETIEAFTVHDRRGAMSAIGQYPGDETFANEDEEADSGIR